MKKYTRGVLFLLGVIIMLSLTGCARQNAKKLDWKPGITIGDVDILLGMDFAVLEEITFFHRLERTIVSGDGYTYIQIPDSSYTSLYGKKFPYLEVFGTYGGSLLYNHQCIFYGNGETIQAMEISLRYHVDGSPIVNFNGLTYDSTYDDLVKILEKDVLTGDALEHKLLPRYGGHMFGGGTTSVFKMAEYYFSIEEDGGLRLLDGGLDSEKMPDAKLKQHNGKQLVRATFFYCMPPDTHPNLSQEFYSIYLELWEIA